MVLLVLCEYNDADHDEMTRSLIRLGDCFGLFHPQV